MSGFPGSSLTTDPINITVREPVLISRLQTIGESYYEIDAFKCVSQNDSCTITHELSSSNSNLTEIDGITLEERGDKLRLHFDIDTVAHWENIYIKTIIF